MVISYAYLTKIYRNGLRAGACTVTRTFEYLLVSEPIISLESHALILKFLRFSACPRSSRYGNCEKLHVTFFLTFKRLS